MPRLALVQFRPRKAAYVENLARVASIVRDLATDPHPPELVVFPEAALTGYFLEGGVREEARTAEELFADLAQVHAGSGAPPVDVVIGFYELFETRLHNSALVATCGGPAAGIRHVHRKVFLPTYGVFDEERFVDSGREVRAFDLGWGRCAALVCEDAWHSMVPALAALDGAQVVVVVSASPARGPIPAGPDEPPGRPASVRRWDRVAQQVAGEHGIYVVLAQLAGFEGGKALQGASVVAGPGGEIIAAAPLFEEAILRVDLDLEEIARVRAASPMLSDLEMRLPFLADQMDRLAREGLGFRSGGGPPSARPPAAVPAESSATRLPAGDPLAIDPELTASWLVAFIRDEVTRRRGFERALLGLSGGVDSAVVAYLATRALGAEQVTAIRMPYRSSSGASLTHAELVADALGLTTETVDISSAVDGLAGALGEHPDPARLGNIMARMRMITLFDRSAALGALPLGTGNKTERLFGYFTWHGDDAPPVNPLGDLFKSQVWALARYLGVPDVIIDKPATADLVEGQTDEGDFGISYPRADAILHWLLSGYRADAIEQAGFSEAEIELVRRRLDSTHWKRKLPTVAMMSQTAIGEYYLRPVDY
jgi:NAD+ synthetase